MQITVTNTGELNNAFLSLPENNEQVTIIATPGTYEIYDDLAIKRDNITIKGEPGAIFKGSKRIQLSDFKKEGNLYVVDLEKAGIQNLGKFGLGPFIDFWKVYDIPKPHMCDFGPGLELFHQDELMPISRYPKKGFMQIEKALGNTPILFKKTPQGTEEGIFKGNDNTINNWESYKEWLLVGYWNVDYATQRHTVKSFKDGVIEVNEPYHCYGYRDGECFTTDIGADFYILNALEAVTQPGEWFIDRTNKQLYIYPFPGQEYVEISVCDNIISGENVKNICIEGIKFSQCRKSAIFFENSSDIKISDCSAKNLGAWGILGENCTDMIIEKCHVSLTGGGGIGANGGDRLSLTPANNIISNCTIHDIARWHKTYMAAIDISGVGCSVSENYIYDVPHFGIVFAGNNHIIEKNEIRNACYESNDAGAIYSGRNYTFRGNVVRYNYLHDLQGHNGLGCVGLYFDDAMSSAEVYGNIFANIPYIGLLLGGGRDFNIHHNSFYNCKMAIMYDKRASTWKGYKNGGGRLGERLREIDYKCDVWKKAYPELYSIQENDMLMPMGNSICNNTVIGGDGFAISSEDVAKITEISGNTFSNPSFPTEKDKYHADWYYINK